VFLNHPLPKLTKKHTSALLALDLSTADEKAVFSNTLLGLVIGRFTESLYTRQRSIHFALSISTGTLILC
jgi:hypothetical protein